jgi:hypothetical protein
MGGKGTEWHIGDSMNGALWVDLNGWKVANVAKFARFSTWVD